MPYAFVAAEPVRTIKPDGVRRSEAEVARELRRIPTGVIGWGYVDASEAVAAVLSQPGRVNFFIYRDPRDVLVSQVFFATDMHAGHGMHALYKSLPDFGERLKVAITGIERDGLKMVSVRQRYAGVFAWMAQPDVLCIRFEDLVNDRVRTLNAMLDEVEKTGYRIPTPRQKALGLLGDSIRPEKSRTFRSGGTGGWREYFTAEHKALFKEVAGDLVIALGYEKDNAW